MTPPGPGDRARTLAYQRDFWPGLVGYALVLPALLVVRAVARHLRRIDGYQRGLLLAFRLARLFGRPIEQLFHPDEDGAPAPMP